MSAKAWEEYIHNKLNFYSRHRALERNDSEFTWKVLAPAKPSVKSRLKKVPFLYAAYESLSAPQDHWQTIKSELEPLYEVRCLLNDELSQLLFDQAVILRLVSYNRFFFPRTTFDLFVEVIEKEIFREPGYPDNYLGLPLEKNKITLEPGLNNIMLNVVAAAGFIELLNIWKQYLISRSTVEFRPNGGDVVFDCGTCIGDMAIIFAGLVGPEGQVHGFDPIPLHNKVCALQKKLNPALAKALIFNPLAVGKDIQKVSAGATSDTTEIAPGGLQIDSFNMTNLDGYVDDHNLNRVDFIKMDIEGAERDALVGAENVIRSFKPKLAISTYHRADDFWSLPLQIKKINPSYKFAFGHHSPLNWESVIYAFEP